MSAKETEGCVFFERGFGKKDTSWEGEGQKRHKVDVRVVPFGSKKGNKYKRDRNPTETYRRRKTLHL